MIKPLHIGRLQFASNLIQGPLAGYTCAPMRRQAWLFSQPAYCSTEMVSASHLVYAKKTPIRFIERDPIEQALCFQLSADDPEILAEAVQKINVFQPEIIELNCGCPVNKIRRKGAGSKLLSDPERLKKMVNALRKNTQSAVSIKIRVSDEQNDQDDLLISKIIEEEGADALVVHGRHWSERYDVPCRYSQIRQIVEAVKIPVIGNGDVSDFDSLKKMITLTNCAGVMIGRASMGQPWIFANLTAQSQHENYQLPSPAQIGEIFIDHIERLARLDSEYRAVLQARKMAKYYARNAIPRAFDFVLQIMQCSTMDSFRELVRQHF